MEPQQHPFSIECPAEYRYWDDMNGHQYVFKFSNGYCASVIQDNISYGGMNGLWEVAMLDHDEQLFYCDIVDNDVVGWLDRVADSELLVKIAHYGD